MGAVESHLGDELTGRGTTARTEAVTEPSHSGSDPDGASDGPIQIMVLATVLERVGGTTQGDNSPASDPSGH
jgi:hypothetical protein